MNQGEADLKKIGTSADLTCARKFDYYLIDIFRNKIKACCKTNYYPQTQTLSEDLAHILKDRQDLQRGIKIPGCEACWQLESSGHSSFRTEASYRGQQNMQMGSHEPFILEFWVGNTCNLKCVYCNSAASSKWAQSNQEQKVLTTNFEISPEVEAFIEQTWATTDRFNIVGGEPSLTPATFRIVTMIHNLSLRYPNSPKKTLSVVSNLATPSKTFHFFLDKLESLTDHFNVDIAISAENIGDQYEFVRDGADFKLFEKNLENLLSRDQFLFSLLSSHSILSLKNYHLFLSFLFERVIQWQRKINLIYNEVVYPKQHSPRTYPTRLDEERAHTARILKSLPPAHIPYQNFFNLFCTELDQLYSSVGQSGSITNVQNFLDAAAPTRLSAKDWRSIFPELSGSQKPATP